MSDNVVSIAVDDLIAFLTLKNMFGDTLITPNLDRLMAMGVNFENAFSQVALCNPSRTSILTGQRPETTNVHDNTTFWASQVNTTHTLPAILSASGYETSVLGKIFHTMAPSLAGLPGFEDIYAFTDRTAWTGTEYAFRSGPLLIPEEQHGDYINTSEAIRLINGWAEGSKNAMFLGLFKPHSDWVVPQKYFDMYKLEDIKLPVHPNGDIQDLPDFIKQALNTWYHDQVVAADAWPKLLQAYFACITFADAQIGRVLDALEAQGHLDDTAIVLWSDHGYHLGDKDNWHKFTLWDESARAPLIIYDPQQANTGHTVSTPVEMLDIVPTILDMLNITPTWQLEGRSLTGFFDPNAPDSGGQAITTMYGSVSIRTDQYRYIRYEDGSQELYDVIADPNEITNLAGQSSYAGTMSSLWSTIRAELEPGGWRFVAGSADFSSHTQGLDVVLQSGAARVIGGKGDDTYFITDSAAQVVEGVNGGKDTVYILRDYVLPDNVENGHARQQMNGHLAKLTGNALDNFLTGSTYMKGMAGNDTIQMLQSGIAEGGTGNDSISGSGEKDRIFGDEGDDYLNGFAQDDFLSGGAGNDKIYGGLGNDLIAGGAGNNWVFGNDGVNTLEFRDMTVLVKVNMLTGKATSTLGTTTFKDFRDVSGSMGGIEFIGDAANNIVSVYGANNVIDGGGGTADTVKIPVARTAITSVTKVSATQWTIKYLENGQTRTLSLTNVEKIITTSSPEALDIASLLLPPGPRVSDFDNDRDDDLLFQRKSDGATFAVDGGSGAWQRGFGPRPLDTILGIADVNGDGAADFLTRMPNGDMFADIGINGSRIYYGNRTDFDFVALFDVDGNGTNDIILRNKTLNDVIAVKGTGGFLQSFFNVGTNKILAVGDFNGDKRADLLLEQANGVTLVRDGATGATRAFEERRGFDVLATADFDKDGGLDLLVRRQSDGWTYVLDGSGTGAIQRDYGNRAAGAVIGVGDLNGDGAADLVVRTPAGNLASYNGATNAVRDLGTYTNQIVLAIADFDGDGGDDLLLQRGDGALFVVNGDTSTTPRALGTAALGSIIGIGDFNGNGVADILIRDGNGVITARDGFTGANTSYGNHSADELILPLNDMLGFMPDLFG